VVGTAEPIRTGSGQILQPGATLADVEPELPSLVVVPGCNCADQVEVEALLALPEVRAAGAWLSAAHRGGSATIAGSCAATFVLAEHGLLDGQRATTSWWHAPQFRARYPQIDLDETATVVRSGRTITGGAAFAQLDVALTLVAWLAGAEVARGCMQFLVLDHRPSQARYAVTHALAHTSPEALRAERWIREHLAEEITLPALARATGTSPRTLARRVEQAFGLTPMRLVARLRIEQAVHLLESTDWPFQRVADEVGSAPAQLRRALLRERGETARDIRRRRAR
jgi:transcriptional regulator GlxA family with amidase domain